MKRFICFIVSLTILITLLSSCSADTTPTESHSGKGSDNELKIVTTIFPIYDWVKNITGKDNAVYLDENGIDLHSFEPTANDIIRLSDADIFIYIGGESDNWVENAVKAANNPDIVTVSLITVTGSLEEETVEGMETDDEDAAADEHIWLSLKKARAAVTAIADTLCTLDGTNAQAYKKNAEDYLAKLQSLDEKYAQTVKHSASKTVLFADRFPFRYMTEDYGINYFAAFPGCAAESEASFETMSFLINKTKELSLPCIIRLEESDGKIAETVSSETNAKIVTMNSCQSVTQKDVADGITYISVMEKNLKALTEALS